MGNLGCPSHLAFVMYARPPPRVKRNPRLSEGLFYAPSEGGRERSWLYGAIKEATPRTFVRRGPFPLS